VFTRNVTTHNTSTNATQSTFNRAYMVPTSWTPPPAAVVVNPRTGAITTHQAPTPPVGSGDPRICGTRTVYQQNNVYVIG